MTLYYSWIIIYSSKVPYRQCFYKILLKYWRTFILLFFIIQGFLNDFCWLICFSIYAFPYRPNGSISISVIFMPVFIIKGILNDFCFLINISFYGFRYRPNGTFSITVTFISVKKQCWINICGSFSLSVFVQLLLPVYLRKVYEFLGNFQGFNKFSYGRLKIIEYLLLLLNRKI